VAISLICGVSLPVQAEEDEDGTPVKNNDINSRPRTTSKSNCFTPFYHNQTSGSDWLKNRDNWKIAKANVDSFFSLDDQAIADLFEYKPDTHDDNVIDLDEHLALVVQRSLTRPVQRFSFGPKNKGMLNNALAGIAIMTGPPIDLQPDTVWTGAKRKNKNEYWTIIKDNLDKFIGMNQAELIALLGPPRCSSKHLNVVTFRIGDAGLDFGFKDDKVEKFRFESNRYIPGT
jgi:hypothetical protein